MQDRNDGPSVDVSGCDATQLICKMIENDCLSRSKIVKMGGLDVLLKNIDNIECLKCLEILVSKSRLAKSKFSPTLSFFRQLSKEDRPTRLSYFWSISKHVQITRERFQLLCSSIFANASMNPPLATELAKRLLIYNFSPVVVFLTSSLGKTYDVRVNLLYDVLAKSDPCIRRTLAKRLGRSVVSSLSCQYRVSGAYLLKTLAHDLRLDCIQPYLVDILISDTSFVMVFVVHCLIHKYGEQASEQLQKSKHWNALLSYLCSTDEIRNSRARFALLLQFYMSGAEIDCKTDTKLAGIIAAHPEVFYIVPTREREALERIVQVGRRLKLTDASLEPHIGILKEFQKKDMQKRSLESVGLFDYALPSEFTCPVTLDEFVEPVIASDGHTYEKQTLERIFKSTCLSPLTRETLNPKIMIPNLNLKKRMDALPDEIFHAIVESKRKRQRHIAHDESE